MGPIPLSTCAAVSFTPHECLAGRFARGTRFPPQDGAPLRAAETPDPIGRQRGLISASPCGNTMAAEVVAASGGGRQSHIPFGLRKPDDIGDPPSLPGRPRCLESALAQHTARGGDLLMPSLRSARWS